MVSPIRKVVNKICMLRRAHGIVADRAHCKDLAEKSNSGDPASHYKAKNLSQHRKQPLKGFGFYSKKVAEFGVQLLRRNKRYKDATQDG